jgi:hypothetical protein
VQLMNCQDLRVVWGARFEGREQERGPAHRAPACCSGMLVTARRGAPARSRLTDAPLQLLEVLQVRDPAADREVKQLLKRSKALLSNRRSDDVGANLQTVANPRLWRHGKGNAIKGLDMTVK